MRSQLAAVHDAINHLSRGGIIIAVDRERENEGDFLAIADHVSSETIHFMTTHARGHLCMPIHPTIAARLHLAPLVPENGLGMPRFAMPIDHRDCNTGISPDDRALTVQKVVNHESNADDFRRPGHVFPLIAQAGGVVHRPGHTEASVDLAMLAGASPAAILCEVCSKNGRTMADHTELQQLSKEFDLPILAVDTLIDFRRRNPHCLNIAEAVLELEQDVRGAIQSTNDFKADKQSVKGHGA